MEKVCFTSRAASTFLLECIVSWDPLAGARVSIVNQILCCQGYIPPVKERNGKKQLTGTTQEAML